MTRTAITIVVTVEADETEFDAWRAEIIDRGCTADQPDDPWQVFLNEMEQRLADRESINPDPEQLPRLSAYGAQLSAVVHFEPDTEPF